MIDKKRNTQRFLASISKFLLWVCVPEPSVAGCGMEPMKKNLYVQFMQR